VEAPAGWYPDPRDPRRIRWWDGAAWTEHTAPQPEGSGPYPSAAPEQPYAAVVAEPAPDRRSVLPLIAGVVAFLVLAVGAVAILLGTRSSGSPQARPAPSSAAPSPSTPTPEGSRTGTASPSPGSTQGGADGATLETFRPPDGLLGSSIGTELITDGDTTKDPTLDGWCSSSYATEKDRVARRQWALTVGGQRTGWSVEVVAYGTEAQAKAALAEFVARTKACRDVTITQDGDQQTQNLVSTPKVAAITGISAAQGRITIDFVVDGSTTRANSLGLVQQRGRFLSVIWGGQQSAFSADDDAVLDRLRQQQADALLSAG
jgi:hypothetical protein